MHLLLHEASVVFFIEVLQLCSGNGNLLTTAATNTTSAVSPTTALEQFQQTFNITNGSVASTMLSGFSAAPTKFAYGIYLENVTWFEANATCYADGYEQLLHNHDPKRMYWATKRHLIRTRASLTDLYYWTGYLRIQPCSNAMVNSSCGTDVDRSIPVYELGVIEKQCLANNYSHLYKLDQHNWRYCNELHPFICEKQLGDVTYKSVNFNGVPVKLSYDHTEVAVYLNYTVSDCKNLCSMDKTCKAITYDHSVGMCWVQLNSAPETSFQIKQVDNNVTTLLKEGFVIDIISNASIAPTNYTFVCQNESKHLYTENSDAVCPLSLGSSSVSTSAMYTTSETTQASPVTQNCSSLSTPTCTSATPSSTSSKLVQTSSSNSYSLSTQPNVNKCKCPCGGFHFSLQLNSVDAAQAVAEIIKRLEIHKQNTGSYKRQLSSAEDGRTSSVMMGCVGVVILICTFGIIIVFDILRFVQHIK